MTYSSGGGGTSSASLPSGTVFPFAGSAAPDGWMTCDGASLLRADYVDLFSAIGTAYGAADGTHFNLPDLRGRHILGACATHALASSGGSFDHTHTGPAGHSDHS